MKPSLIRPRCLPAWELLPKETVRLFIVWDGVLQVPLGGIVFSRYSDAFRYRLLIARNMRIDKNDLLVLTVEHKVNN